MRLGPADRSPHRSYWLRFKMDRQALVLIALVAGAIGGPISQDKGLCAKTCSESSRFNYETGKTYEFSYKADTLTTLAGAAEEHSSLHIRAIADIEVQGPCDFVLKLRDTQLLESDPRDQSKRTLVENNADFARALEAAPLSFAFQDGRVETLCASTSEPAWVLNIKRGILSAFQNNMPEDEGTHTVKETDVAGNCESVYSVTEKKGSSVTMKRSKNLLGCTERNNHVTAFQATPYKVESAVQSLPLMKSHHDCVQTVTAGVLQSAECTEKHIFRPFSNSDNGALTHSVQKLELTRHHHSRHHKHHGPHHRTNMLFQHAESQDGLQMERTRAKQTLEQICNHEDMRPHTAQLFSQLTYNLRQLDTMSLSELHQEVHDSRVCSKNHQQAQKFFRDAIPMVGTSASISLIRDLVMNAEVTGMEADQWLTSLAFIATPNADMIREIRPLLEAPAPSANMLLAVSAMTNTFCRTSGNCADNMDVQDMVRLLTNNLRSHCNGDRELVLMSLKALGNLGQGQIVSTLARCAAHSANPTDVRVAAMSASRSMPCSQNRRAFLETFANAEEDSEIRINAYLASMACPSPAVISVVKRMLEKEEVNQVGSFVWTHLTNLQETTDPFKEEIKEILQDEELKKTFDMDKRKFSRNYEGSMFFDSVNTGAKMESNMIWSSKSYVPRSGMLNLTVDLFGHSVNLMELGGRVEGMEHLIESLFGSEGYFPENAVSTALKRARRSTSSEKINRVEDRFAENAENTPRGSMYMKVFGNELRYVNLDSTTLTNPAENINLLDILLKLSRNQEADFSKSFMFLDSTLTVPTIVGVPMKLSVNGTATVKLALGGKMDVRQAAASPRSLNIDGYVKPSGAIEMSSMMSVDAFVARTGLKMVSTLHTSTEVNGQLSVQDSQVVLGKFNMPRDKIEIVSVESKFFVVHREVEREQKMLTEGRYTKAICTGATLKKIAGVELCGELEFPRSSAAGTPYFPFTGPSGLKVFLNKADTHSSYDFEARLQTVRERHSSPIQSQVARLSFNTPGSQVNRELYTDVILNHMDKSLNANLRSPWKKAVVTGALVNEEAVKRAALTLTVDEQHEYSINSHVKIAQRGNKMVLTPTLELSLAGLPTMTAQGSLRAVPGDRVNGEVTIENVFKKPLTLKGGLDKEVRKNGLVRYSSNLEVRTDSPLVKATASVDHRDGMKRTTIDVVYRLAGPRHRLRFNGQMKDAVSRQLYTLNLGGELSSTQFPALDHEVKVSMKHQPRHFEVDANLRYGDDDKTDVRRIILSHESNIRNKPNALNMDHTTKLTWKAMNIDVDSKINHRHSNDEVKTKAIVAYSPGKTVDLDVHFHKEDSSPLIIVADATLSYPGRSLALHEKLQEKASGYAHEMSLQWQEGSRLTSQGELIISPKNKYDLRLEINPPRMPSTVLTTSNSFNLDDFHTEATVVHSGAKYSAATSWKYTKMESADAKIDIQYPSRQVIVTSMVKATAEAGIYEHDTTVMWDAKRDTSKKMQVSAVFKNQNNKMEGDFNIIHLARKYNMAIISEMKNGKMISHGELTWAPGKTASLDTVAKYIKEAEGVFALEGSAKFNSPIKYLEKLMASVEGTSNANLYNNKMIVSWAEGKQISTVFNVKKLAGWRNIESDLTILNPFTDAVTGAVNLNTMDNQLILHTEGSYGSGEKVVLDVSGKNNYPASVDASIKVKTPLRAVRRIGASVDHSLRNGQLSSSINGFINNKKVQLAVTGKDLSGDAHRDASINVLLTTPFENFEHLSAQAKHSKNGHKFSNTLEASLGKGKTISGSLDLVHQSNNQVTIRNGNLRITTPFRNVENLFANWVHDIRSSNVKVNYDIGANSQHMKMDLTHLTTGSQEIASHLQIQTPFQAVRNIIVDGLKKNDGDNTKMSLSVSRNNAAVMSINSELKLAEMNFAGQLDMKVLDKSFETSASLKADTTPYTGHVEFKWNENSKVALSGDLAINNQAMRGNLLFVSPFQSFERLMMTMDHTASNDRYTSATSFEYASDKKIEIDTMFDKNGGIAYSLALKSPCNYLNVLNIQGEHKQQVHKVKAAYVSDSSRMVAESNVHAASLEDINADIKFTSSMTEDITMTLINKKVGSEWHTDAALTFAPRQKVEVKTVLSLTPEIKIDLGIKTPFYQFSNAKASFEHSGEQSNFQNRLSFNMMAGGEKTEFSSSSVVNGLRRINSNVKINNPRIAPVDLALNHNMAHGNFHSVLSSGSSKKIDIYMTTDAKKTTFVLKTPFQAMTELQINGEHEVTDTKNSKFEVSMTTYGKTGKLSGHCNVKATDFLDSLLMLETPENTITFLAKHGKFSDKWVSTAAFSYAPEKTIAMELNVIPADQEATLSFNSPFKGFEDLHLMGAAKSTRNMKYGKLQFNTPNNQMKTEMRVRHGKKMALDLKMETPCQYMKSMAIKTSMSGSIDDFKVNAEISHNLLGGTVDFDAAVKAALDDVDALITFRSPFNGFENLKLKVNHKEQGSHRYTSSVDAGYAAKKLIQLRSQLSLSSLNHMQGQLTLTTPCPAIRSVQMAFNHDGELTNLKTHFEAQINEGKKSAFDLSFQAADAIRASFKAVTPFEAVDNVDFSFYHSGPISAFETHSELKYNNNQKISTSVNFNGRSGASGRFVLNTPFTNDLIVTINHEGDLLNFRHNSKVEYANKNIILSGAAAINNNVDVQFELKTPFDVIKKVGAVITHKGSMLNFNSGLQMFLNEEVIDAKLDLVAENNVKVEFNLQTPFEPVTDVTFDLSHSGSIRNFKSKVMVTYAPQQSITVEGSFNMDNDLNVYIHILSPFEAVNDMAIRFDHKNNMNGWTQDTSVEHNAGKLVDIKNVYKNTPDIEVSSVITSPYEMLKQITFNFNHKQSGQAANTNVIINVNGIITRGDMTLKMTPQKEIVLHFQSPIPHANDVTLTASADVTADMIYGAVEFNSDDFKGVKVQAEYKVAPEVSGRFSIETPFKYMEKHTAAFTYAGSFPDFRAHAELDLTNIGKMQLDSDLATSSAVVGQIRLQTPFKNAKEYSVVLNHEGNTGSFKSNIKVASKEHFTVEGQANLKLGYDSEGSISFTSDLSAIKDFSASFNHRGNMVNFVSHAEATCTDCGKIEVDAKLSETEAEFELKTPFKNIKKYTVAASLNGPMNNFVSKVAVSSQEHFKMEINTNLKVGQQNAGSISFTSDIKAIKDFSASFNHDGNMVNFVSHAEATCTNCGRIEVDAKLTDTEAEFELKTPFENIKKYSVAASLNGPMNNFVSKVVVSSQEHFNMEVNTNLKVGQQNAGSISFTSDIKAIKDFSASFSHDGNMVNFVSHAEATCTNCGKIEVDAKLTDTEAAFELKTPFKNIKKYSVAASLNGPMNNFVSKVVVSSQEHFNMEVNTNLKVGQQNAGSISFTSDIKAIKDFSVSFSHDGNMVNFVSHAEATCTNCGKIEVDAKLTDTEAEFELKTPFKNIKKYNIAASLNGPMNNFVSKVVVSSKEHFKMEVNTNLKVGQQNAGSISFTSDIKAIKDFSASFSHNGDKNQFTSHAEATCSGCGKIEVGGDFAASPLRGEFKLRTPFKNMEENTVIFSHDGPANNFKSMVTVVSQGHFNVEVNANLKTVGAMSGGLSFTSDIKAIKDFSISFTHLFSNGQFRSHAEAACSGCGKIEVDGDFTMAPVIRGEFKFQSPITNMKQYTISFNHDGDLINFVSEAEFKSIEHATINLNGNLKTINGLQGAFAFKSNLNVVSDFNIAFDHSGNMEQFRSHAEFNCAEWGAVSADADFRSVPSIVGNFHLATPMPGMENFRLNIKHNGDLDNFKSSAEFTYGYKQAIKASLAAKTSPSVDINIKLETPFSDDIEVTLIHNGDIKKFSGSATLLKKTESMFHYEVSFDMTSAIQGSLKLQNVFMENEAQISFKGDNKQGVFKGETEMSFGSDSISTEIELKHNNGIEVSFKINTPWQQVKNVEVEIAHKMWKRRVQSEVLLKHNNQRYEGKINLKFKPVIDGELSVKTPFSQARDISLTIKHQGDLSDFEHGITVKHNGQQKLNGNVNFKVSPRIEGSIELATALPQMKQLHATIGHSGDYNHFNSHATLSHNGEQKFQGQMTVQTYPSVQAEMKFQTPFSAARDVSASFSHDGSLQRFHSQGVINHNGMKVFNGDATFTVQPNIHGEMKITTPGNNIMGIMSHDGSLSTFKSLASLTHNGEKKFNTEVSFATQPFISGDLRINTPFSILRDIEATFSHAGSARRFTNSASISHNGEEKFNSELSFKTNPTVEAKFTLNNKFVSAFRQFSTSMSHSGSLKNFVTTAEAKYNGQEALNAEISLETSPVLKANFKFETPLTKLQDAGINVKYEGHIMDFVVDASAQYKGEKFVGTLVKFQLEGTTLKTQFNLKTPYTSELNMVYNHEGTLQRFQCHAEVNHMKADLAFAMLNGGMTVTLKSSQPELLDFSANVKYSTNSIKADLLCALGKFDVEGSYKQKPMSVEFRLATPFEQAREVNFDMSHRGNSRALYSSLNMKHNGKNVVAFSADFKNYARTIGNLHFKSMIPYMEKLAASFRHEMSAKGLKSQASAAYYNNEISTEADIKFEPKVSGIVTVLTPFNGFKKTSLKFSHLYQQDVVNADAVLKYAGQEIKINANFDRKPTTMDASIELNTPFRAIKSVGGSMNLEGNWQNMKTSSQVFLNKKVIKVEKVYREDNGQPVEASIILYTPFTNLEQTSLQMTDNIEGTRHQPRVVFSWAKQQIQLAGNYNKQRQGVEGSLTLTTPFALLKQLTIAGNADMNAAGVNTDVNVNYNGNKVLHTQAEYKNAGNKHNAAFTMITPHPMKTEVEFNGLPLDFTAKASLHWDTRNANKKISTEVSHKLEGAKRLMAIRIITVNRITGLKTEFEHSASTFLNKVELIWDEANDKKVSYDVSVVAKPTRSHRIYETRARLNTPIRSLEFTLNHKDNGRLYETALNTKWDAVRDASRQLTLNNRYENTGSRHLHQLVISHPKMAKDIVLRNEWSMNVNDIIYSGRTEIEYTGDASDTLTMSTLVQDHSGNYSVELGLSHPQSRLDVKMNSHMLNTPSTFSAAMGVNYMTARRKVNNLSLRGEIEKIRKQLTMELLTPVKKLQLNGKVKESDNMYSVNVVATEDEENQVSAKLNLDTDAQTMDMKAYYSAKNPKNMMHVYGKYIDGNSLVMEATRHHNGEQFTEGQVSMDLKDQNLMHSKVFWRPEAMQDAKFATKKAIKHARQDVALLLKIVEKSLIKEKRAKMDHIRRALPNHKPVAAYLKAEIQSVTHDVRVVRKEASNMFNSNEFYVRTAYRFSARQLATLSAALAKVEQAIIQYTETVSRALEAFSDKMAVVAADALQVCTEVCDLAKAKMYNATRNARRYLKVAMAKYYQLHNIAAQKYMQVRTYVLAKVDMYVEIALNKAAIYGKQAWALASDIAVKTQAKIDEYIARLMSCPHVQHVLARLNRMLNKATSYFAMATERIGELLSKINMAAINSVHEVVSGHVQRTMEALNQRAERLLEAASQVFTSMQNMVSQYVQNAVEHENSEHVRRYMQLAINKMSATYTELNVESRTKALVRDAVMSVVNFVKANSYYIINDYFHFEENKVIEWNPTGGHIEAQVYIPMEAPSMQFVTFVNLPATYRRVKAEVNSLVPEFDYTPMDTYYKYKPSSDVSNWLPPFKAAATLAGRQHFITFDGKHYEFAAPCSYLLARDFIDGNFSMVVNYDGIRNGVSKRSVVVSSSGKDVEIFSDGNFTIAGETSSLPAEWGSTLVTLEDSILKVSDKKGVTVVCDLEHDSCTLHVSGFYFGKMAGLFGTYNNEQSDDFTTAEGTKVTSVSQFAASWAVGRRCARTRNMARVSPTASSRACSQLFHNKNSPLRPCFAVVDPVHFEAMCVNDVMHTEGAECNIASVYVAECRRQEVPVSLPASCSIQSEVVEEAVQENFIEDLEAYVGQKI